MFPICSQMYAQSVLKNVPKFRFNKNPEQNTFGELSENFFFKKKNKQRSLFGTYLEQISVGTFGTFFQWTFLEHIFDSMCSESIPKLFCYLYLLNQNTCEHKMGTNLRTDWEHILVHLRNSRCLWFNNGGLLKKA